jgi:hypothetical protein
MRWRKQPADRIGLWLFKYYERGRWWFGVLNVNQPGVRRPRKATNEWRYYGPVRLT